MQPPQMLTHLYDEVTRVVEQAGPAGLDRLTRAAAWDVGDLLWHLLLDAQRALVTLASPADGPPDVDGTSYWRPFRPSNGDGGAAHAAFVCRAAAAHADRWDIVESWRTTAPAATRVAEAADPDTLVTTQGHVLSAASFASTLVTEATVHLLDLTLELPGGPAPEALAHTRDVLAGLLGASLPTAWDDRRAVLLGTGREPLTDADRTLLGDLVDRFPLLG